MPRHPQIPQAFPQVISTQTTGTQTTRTLTTCIQTTRMQMVGATTTIEI